MSAVAPRTLALLARLLDSPVGRTAPAWLDQEDQPALKALHEAGAVKNGGDSAAVLCPSCERQDLAPERHSKGLRALCPECGYVPISDDSLNILVPDVDWLLKRMRQALGMDQRQDSAVLVDGVMWKVGDIPQGKTRRRRVVFARRLTDPSTHRVVLKAFNDHIEKGNGIVIGMASRSTNPLEHLSLPYVHIADLFRWRAGKLELDDGLWQWCLKPAHLRNHERSTIFFEGFRTAIVDGEQFTFSATQAEFWEHMVGLGGSKAHKTTIMSHTESNQESPRELFRHNADHLRAFDRLVDHDDEGFYWLKPT